MRRAKYIFCMILMVHGVSLEGQSRSDLREMFVSAEGDILFEDYAEALPKYLSLLQIYPDNFNLYYRVGQCYLNTPGEKDQSIPWLESAASNIDPDHRPGRLGQKGAPYDALYLLANAYRITSDFDRALETYERFLKDVDTEKYDTALVRFQMQTCHNARIMMRRPVYVVDKNLGEPVNERFSESNPVISADEKSLLFTRELQFYDAIFWSRKIDGKWTEPVNLTPQLGVDQDYYTSSLSPDGRTLLMYRVDTYDGNIYMSRLQGDSWTEVEKLNGNINTKYWESHATMSSDGKRIYFTSNRRESLGGLDIFVSVRDSSGNWGPAVNLGPEVNTIYNEQTPFLTNNDSTLYFSSRGHFNMGGYDIFRSDLGKNGRWSTPVNVGYPLNTTDDDLFFSPLGRGNRGYYGKFADDGFGKMDIYSCDIYSELNPRKYIVTGKASVASLMPEFPQPVKVTAVSTEERGRIISALTNPLTGLYTLRLPQGRYNIKYESYDVPGISREIILRPDSRDDTVTIQPVTLITNDLSAYLRLLSDTLVTVNSPDPVNLDLITEEMAILKAEVLSPDSVKVIEQFTLKDTTFTFTFNPAKGDNRVSFMLTDRFGNDTGTVVTVRRKDAIARAEIPLYHEIPVRPAGQAVTGINGAAGETGSATGLADSGTAESSLAVNAPDTTTAASSAGTEQTDPADDGGKCIWWWLAALAVLIIFFIILRRRKNEKEKESSK